MTDDTWPDGWDETTSGADGMPPTGVPDTPEEAEARRAQLAEEENKRKLADFVRSERLRRQAKRVVDEEEAVASWRVPQQFGTLADELTMPEDPVTFRVSKIIPSGANVVITAQFKAGKTTLVNNLVKSLVDGKEFLGHYPVQRLDGRVGVLNYEVGAQQYRRWLRETDIVNTDRVALLHLRGLRMPLTTGHVEDWLVGWLVRNEVEVWMLDPFARAITGCGDESSNADVGLFLDTLDVIKERAGVRELVMPAHTGRGEQEVGKERARGATRLDDWADVRWILTKDDEARRYLSCTGRDVEEAEQPLRYHPEDRSLTLVVGGSRRGNRRNDMQGQVVGWLRNHPGSGVNDVCRAFPNRKAEITALLKAAVEVGLLRVQDGPNSSKLHFVTAMAATPPVDDRPPPWAQTDMLAGIQ